MNKREFDRMLYIAGGTPSTLRAVFLRANIYITRQAVQQWVRNRRLPPQRELELRRIRPWWNWRVNGQEGSKAKAVPARKAAAIKSSRGPRKAGQTQREKRGRSSVPQ